MKDMPLEYYNQIIMNQLKSGKRMLFGVRKYDNNRVELVQFDLLFGKDIYTAIIFDDVPEHLQIDFPAGSIIWLNIDKQEQQWRFTEATELDERAKWESDQMRLKMAKQESALDAAYKEGQSRIQSLRWIN